MKKVHGSGEKNIINHRCFSICEDTSKNADMIYNIFNVYDVKQLSAYIDNKIFDELSIAEKLECIDKFNRYYFKDKINFISTLSNKNIPCENYYIYANDNDYINPLTLNKMLYSLILNLYNLKNSIIGTLKTIALNDNIVTCEDFQFDNYYKLLEENNIKNYFIYDNELINVALNRIFESIYNIQFKILERMQSLHFSFEPNLNKTAKII